HYALPISPNSNIFLLSTNNPTLYIDVHISPNFVNKCQVVIQCSSYCCLYKYISEKTQMYQLVTLILIFTRQVSKPQNVTHTYCLTPYQCTATTSTNYSSLHFLSE